MTKNRTNLATSYDKYVQTFFLSEKLAGSPFSKNCHHLLVDLPNTRLKNSVEWVGVHTSNLEGIQFSHTKCSSDVLPAILKAHLIKVISNICLLGFLLKQATITSTGEFML